MRFGLGAKLLVAIAIPAILSIALILLTEHLQRSRTVSAQTSQLGTSLAESLSAAAGSLAAKGSVSDLQGIVNKLQQNPLIEYADFVRPDGRVLASSGSRGVPASLLAMGRPVGAVDHQVRGREKNLHISIRPLLDTSASSREAPAGYLRLVVNERGARDEDGRSKYLTPLGVLLALGTAAYLTFLSHRSIVRPIRAMTTSAREFAQGNLQRRETVGSADEIGILDSALSSMATSFDQSVGKVGQVQRKLVAVVQNVGSRSAAVIAGVEEQRLMLDEAYGSIEQLNAGIRKITDNVDDLSTSSEETSSSMLEMAASMEEVSRHTDTLLTSVEDTASATHQMVSSISEVDQNVDFLQSFVVETSSSMSEMNASISQVETNAAKSYDLARAVAQAAEAGMGAVRETVKGMEQIREAVVESNGVMSRLGEKSSQVGKILGVIEDVAEQTNLLALNAAILAAQAGEQGRGFAVVASQIRDLSERTARSTREIAEIISSVQEEVGNATVAMARGSRTAETGVALSQDAGRALDRILDSADKASSMGREIASATREQAKGSEAVTAAISRLQEMVRQINSATTQQAAGSNHILKAVESMRDVTRYVRQATVEQKSGSVMISDAADRIIEKVREIFEVAKGQAAESEKIVKTIEQIRTIAETGGHSAAEMAESIASMSDSLRILGDEVRRFKSG
ncbi:MAG TPA: HAMP domain-containing methyl-accepting chemotaxis protein [Thermoanaerobaculia bacterium]|nr:HAMP domain-containing methyl-accepting chemotaxis protein [Thermoanaerobaculia bacterium]